MHLLYTEKHSNLMLKHLVYHQAFNTKYRSNKCNEDLKWKHRSFDRVQFEANTLYIKITSN